MERVQFIVILHTEMGNADVVSNFLDEVAYPEVAGTVAGADTIVITFRRGCGTLENMIFKIESINRREFFLGRIESATKWFGYSGNCFGYGRATATLTATAVAEIAVGGSLGMRNTLSNASKI